MDAKELIEKIDKARHLADVLSPAGIGKQYKEAAKLLHPDRCRLAGAGAALARLNQLKEIHEKGIPFVDDAGEFRVFGRSAVFGNLGAMHDVSYRNFRLLSTHGDEASEHFRRYLPRSMDPGRGQMPLRFPHRAIPASGLTLPQEHVNWVLSRMLEFCAWLSQIGYVHCGLNPESVFIVPETHGIMVVSFYHLCRKDSRMKTISAKYRNWYPAEVFSRKRALPAVDLELCKRTAACLLGDRSGLGIKFKKTHNKDFINFLLKRHTDALACYDEYRTLLSRNFEQKFYPLEI